MEIRDEHVEFAIVERFREMLQEPHAGYEVSSIYALFAAILCWSTQRLRTNPGKDKSTEGLAAAKVWAELEREPISIAPWSIVISDGTAPAAAGSPGRSFASSAFRSHTADRLIKNLRDAVAHGDARKVEPSHACADDGPERTLVGFTFKCEERDRQGVTWTGEVTLHGEDMARIAGEVARRFCAAMEKASTDRYLKVDATKGVKEAAYPIGVPAVDRAMSLVREV
jgi:hypothetical protein